MLSAEILSTLNTCKSGQESLGHQGEGAQSAKRRDFEHVKHVQVWTGILCHPRERAQSAKRKESQHVKHVQVWTGIPLYLCLFVQICHQSRCSFALICIQEIRAKGSEAGVHYLSSMPWADLPRGSWAERQLVLFGLGRKVAFFLNAESRFRAAF